MNSEEKSVGKEFGSTENKEDTRAALLEELASYPIPWEDDEEYDDGVIHAFNLNAVETDPTGWVDIFIAECEVENKKTGDRLYVSATLNDEYWSFNVSEESMIESEDYEEVEWLENYETLYEARNSLYYEVFRRLMWTVKSEFGSTETTEDTRAALLEELSSYAIPWEDDEEYDDGVIHAFNLKAEETDPTVWVDELIAECEVENKKTGDRLYVSAALADEYWAFCVSEESMIESENLYAVDRLENYGSLYEARKSLYYEVFRRLMWTVKTEL